MKGLVYKEFLLLWKHHKSNLFAELMLLSGFAILYFNIQLHPFYGQVVGYTPCIISGSVCSALASMDGREKWDTYAAALPVSAAEYVSSKYILALLLQTVTFASCAGIVIAKGLTLNGCSMLVAFGVMCYLAPAFLLPVYIAYAGDPVKLSAYRILAFCALVLFVLLASAGICIVGSMNGVMVETVADALPAVWTVCLGSAGLFLLSWPVTIRLYAKRDN